LHDKPSIASLVEDVYRLKKEDKELSVPIKLLERDATNFALSYGQQRLWFLAEFEERSSAYNVPLVMRLKGSLNVDLLKQSVEAVMDRHEVLRSRIERGDLEDGLIIDSKAELRWCVESVLEEEVKDRVQAEIEKPFNLLLEHPLRSSLLSLSSEEHVWILSFHHIATDGWSMGIFMKELSEFYESFVSERKVCVPELSVQYPDYAVWQRDWLKGDRLEHELSYWKNHLDGDIPVLELATDNPRPLVKSYDGGVVRFSLSRDLSEQLGDLARRYNVTMYMTLLAAFRVLLHRYTSQEDIWIGSPIAGRSRSEVEDLIGFFVNTLVLRNKVQGSESYIDVLKNEREISLEAYKYSDVPFEMLVGELSPDRDTSRSPLFQVMFALQTVGGEGTKENTNLDLYGLTSEAVEVDWNTSKFDLSLSMKEREEGLHGVLEYSEDLFEQETIQRMLEHFENLLESIVANPEEEIGRLELLSKSERYQLLEEFNTTSKRYPQDKTVIELFEEQVARTPDNIAVVYQDKELTYGELNERSNQLGWCLREEYAVGPEVCVGILVERSLEMIVGILGILKAGGAYVPMDIEYPQERIDYMVGDAGLNVVLSHREHLSSVPVGCVSLDLEDPELYQEDEHEQNLKVLTKPENLVYIIYTSGSTGKPRGV